MTDYPKVILKPARDKPLKNFHPWVFLGAISTLPEFENGGILAVENAEGTHLGYGYFNRGQSIVGRMLSFNHKDPIESVIENVKSALSLRQEFIGGDTNAYRLINGEGDNLPGLIVDRYADILVVQINTLGMEKLKPVILPLLTELTGLASIFEKSSSQTRRKEGLSDVATWLGDPVPQPFEIVEHGLKFLVNVETGQKTGLFLDQREMRQLVKSLSKEKTVLNCFGYTGGYSVYALAGRAKRADTVDLDKNAIELAKQNVELNGFSTTENNFVTADVFEFLKQKQKISEYDFVVLDPPAFAKRASDVANASRGYREINRFVLEALKPGSMLLTSSCSAHIDRALFQTIIFGAAKQAGRKVRILSQHIIAVDHPVNLYYPEGDYLKSLLLYVE
jgi:23S rRNA (cytosine1962-C5)-methyltransferase